MGLIHWWPLNGDKHDHAGNTSLTCSSTTYESGKVGQALVLSGCDARVANPFIGLDNWSVAFWFKDNGSNDWSDFICFSHNLQRMEVHSTNANWTWYSNGTASGKLFNSGTRISTGNTTGVWHHICIVKNGVNTILYRNGESLLTHNSAVNFTSESAVMHFNSRANTSYGKMSLSDIRCYDHALSPAEVAELKRGLLVHYNFENYIGNIDSVTALSEWQSYIDGSGQNAVGTKTAQADGSILIKSINQNARLRWQKYIAVTKGERYTLSIKYKQVSGDQTFRWQVQERSTAGGGTVYYTHWSTSGHKEKTMEDGWKIISFSFVVQNTGYFMIWLQEGADYQTYNQEYYLKDFSVCKYETEYDCSGNGNHATINGVDIRDGAATGVHSAYFLNGEQWLEHTGAAFDVSTLSVSLWWRSNCTAAKTGYHIPFAIDSGRVEISIPNNGQLRWGGYINGSRQCNNVTCKDANGGTFSLNNGEWHHIVSVFDGTGFLGYVDGVYQGKQGGSGTISYSGKTLRVGKYNSPASSDYGATNAYISDVRVYNTALTQADITSLYNHTVKITPDQVMIGNYLVETSSQIDFYNVDNWNVNGHGSRKQLVEDGIELTALNGWESFAITTPSNMIGKKIVFSFDYKWTSETRGNSGECSVWSENKVYYYINSGALMVSDTSTLPTGQWAHVTAVIDSASTYTGFMNRGKDETGKVYGLICRNFSLQLATESEVKIHPTGVVTTSRYGDSNKVRIIKAGNLTAETFVEI